MIRVIQRRLIIPRGDTGTFTVPALSPGQAGSVGVFTIFDPITKTRIFQKQVELQGNVFNIEFGHGDTVNLQAGDYLWDIKFYKNPIFADNKVIDGEEIDSYYAAFQTPKCEIRETGDAFMSIEGAHADIEDINLILAATQAANAAKDAATEQAGIAADKAEEAAARLAEMIAAIPTKVSELENDSGYLSEETDPTVPAWAKATEKPTYTSQEVGALPDDTFIPSKVSDLVDDSGHYTKPASGIPASDLEETYVKFDDIASTNKTGVVKINSGGGITIAPVGYLMISYAPDDMIKAGSYPIKPITPAYQHYSTFYGLAKAAGSDEKNSELPVGQYTDTAKAAIQAMLDVPSIADIPTNVSELTNDVGYLTQHQDISGKANSADLAAVATSGSYEDLEDKPTIPDVQIAGTSIVENGIADIPIASGTTAGVVKVSNGTFGLKLDNSNRINIQSASSNDIKIGGHLYKPIIPSNQHEATFFGLSKAAGVNLANEENITVGAYPDSAKTAIQQMLGVPSTAAIPTLVSQLTNDSGYLTSFTETDPTVPSWAKAAQKPTYTAAEVGAPTVQEMNTAIGNAIGNINSFDMAVVQELPSQDISTHTIYLVPKTGETNDVYDEYVYINGNWEMVGNTQIDLSNYVQKTDYATSFEAGIVKAYTSGGAYGVYLDSYKTLKIWPSKSADIKNPSNSNFAPIIPATQHHAAFYGLAKAAGDTTQSQSDNATGTYTNEAKAAIRSMIGAAASADISVQDVQMNGTSIVTDGIANVPALGRNALGVAQVNPNYGLDALSNGMLCTQSAGISFLKAGTDNYRVVVSGNQHQSVFYGLAKAAGDTTQSQSDNAVGTYTAEAKAAILSMLGAAASSDIPSLDNYVQKTDYATANTAGIVCIANDAGLMINNITHRVSIQDAVSTEIKSGITLYKPITPIRQHESVFYGLAKLAGADMANSSNAVGTYTPEAKAAIQAMLGIETGTEVVRLI